MRFFKYYFSFFIFASVNSFTFAQKIGVVDTQYILSKLPQYQEAQSRLENQIRSWEAEAQKMQADYEAKKAALENERVLLVGEQLKKREEEVKNLEAGIKNFIAVKFSAEGEINSYRANLAKPFQDQIWNAIKTVTDKNSLGIVLDKSNNLSVIFLDKKYDYTDKVLESLLKGSKEEKNNNSNKTK